MRLDRFRKRVASAKDVLFLSGWTGDTKRYRCDHQAEAFELAGGTAAVVLRREEHLEKLLDAYECFVLHRVQWDDEVERLIAGAHERGKSVLFDTDDLVFEPELAHLVPMDSADESRRAVAAQELHRSRATLEACDAALVSTEFLAERVTVLKDRVAVTHNVVSTEMVEQADDVVHRRSPGDEREGVTIAYLSGTPTHDRDFLEAADAVLSALETDPRTRFLAVGYVTLDERFSEFGTRVQRLPMQRWRALPEILAAADVNLAPLEPASPFTECKSCVKYLEAALLGVPTIASPRGDFVRVIEDGTNGLLAEGADEWRNALQRLVGSQKLRKSLGRAAFDDVRRNYTTAARAHDVIQALEKLAAPAAVSS